MADEEGSTPAEPQEAQAPEESPHGETDWKAEARKWEARAKKALKEDPSTTEEVKRISNELAEVKAEADRLKAEKARTEAIAKTAKEQGVDVDLLGLMAGETPEEIKADAELLKKKLAAIPAYPSVEDKGAGSTPGITKKEILAIKNPAERVKQIAAHSELFK